MEFTVRAHLDPLKLRQGVLDATKGEERVAIPAMRQRITSLGEITVSIMVSATGNGAGLERPDTDQHNRQTGLSCANIRREIWGMQIQRLG